MNYRLLSIYRKELMGTAMLFIVFFHMPLGKENMFHGLKELGNIGVDMFLLLSGMGLWFSWKKINSEGRQARLFPRSTLIFYARRFRRVYPCWLIVAAAYYISQYVMNGPSRITPDIPNMIGNITFGLSFWRVDDGAFWFIPAIMALYLAAPFYITLISRHDEWKWLPAAAVVFNFAIYYIAPLNEVLEYLEIFFSRIPIFLIGINVGRNIDNNNTAGNKEPLSLWPNLLVFAVCLAVCYNFEQNIEGRFPLFLERIVYIPLTFSLCDLLSMAFRRKQPWLAFIGTVSLEFYLIHYHFIYYYLVKPLRWSYLPTAAMVIIITLPLAWLLHKGIKKIIR